MHIGLQTTGEAVHLGTKMKARQSGSWFLDELFLHQVIEFDPMRPTSQWDLRSRVVMDVPW